MHISTPTNSNQKSINHTAEYTSQAEHLQNAPVTKISPNKGPFPDTAATGAEDEFNKLCDNLQGPLQMVLKKDIIWSKKDPLHFWQSLAFTLRSEELTYVAVSSFVDKEGQNKLYIASNDPMTDSQQQEITDIINMFLDLKPVNEIAAKLLPRQLSYIIKQFRKCIYPVYAKIADFKLNSDAADTQDDKAIAQSIFQDDFAKDLSEAMAKVMFTRKQRLSLDDIRELMNLIMGNQRDLKAMKDGTTKDISEESRRMAFHLLKMIRLSDEINFVWKKVKRHQEDKSLQSLNKEFQFISLACHAELAILKAAKDYSGSNTLYIGVSKRPCYCCSIFFKAVEESKSVNFNISIVTTHGKLYGKWNRIENCFEKEFHQVWENVLEVQSAIKKQTQQQTDDNSSVSGSSDEADEDDPGMIKY